MQIAYSWIRVMLLLAMVGGAMCVEAASTEELFNAHYQIDLRDDHDTGSIKSEFRLKAGERIRFELSVDNIELSVHPVSDTEYDMHMIVTRKKDPFGKARLDKVFRGRFGVPLELDAQGEQSRVGGAISIVPLDAARQKHPA